MSLQANRRSRSEQSEDVRDIRRRGTLGAEPLKNKKGLALAKPLPERSGGRGNRTLGQTNDEKTINAFLDEIKASLSRHYYDLQASGESISALKLKNKLCSTDEKPIESVSKMLGHTNAQTTQIYARITERKINQDMDVLSKKLDPQAGVSMM